MLGVLHKIASLVSAASITPKGRLPGPLLKSWSFRLWHRRTRGRGGSRRRGLRPRRALLQLFEQAATLACRRSTRHGRYRGATPDNCGRRPPHAGEDRQHQAGEEEQPGQYRGGSRQHIARAAIGHEAATAADTEPAAFA